MCFNDISSILTPNDFKQNDRMTNRCPQYTNQYNRGFMNKEIQIALYIFYYISLKLKKRYLESKYVKQNHLSNNNSILLENINSRIPITY